MYRIKLLSYSGWPALLHFRYAVVGGAKGGHPVRNRALIRGRWNVRLDLVFGYKLAVIAEDYSVKL